MVIELTQQVMHRNIDYIWTNQFGHYVNTPCKHIDDLAICENLRFYYLSRSTLVEESSVNKPRTVPTQLENQDVIIWKVAAHSRKKLKVIFYTWSISFEQNINYSSTKKLTAIKKTCSYCVELVNVTALFCRWEKISFSLTSQIYGYHNFNDLFYKRDLKNENIYSFAPCITHYTNYSWLFE